MEIIFQRQVELWACLYNTILSATEHNKNRIVPFYAPDSDWNVKNIQKSIRILPKEKISPETK